MKRITIPLFNMAVIGLLPATGFMVWRAVRSVRVCVSGAQARRAEERAREAANWKVPPVIDAVHEDWLLQDQPSSVRPDDPGWVG